MCLVSVIMPTYNSAKYIRESIISVVNQTFTDWELIVVNDESTDDTKEIVEEFCKQDNRITLVNQKNKKQAAARNTSIKASKGKFLAFLDADDIWHNKKLEIQLSVLIKNQNIDVIYTSGISLFQSSSITASYPITSGFLKGDEAYKKLFFNNFVPNLSVLLKRNWVDIIGLQDESLNIVGCEDWDYWIRLAKNGAIFFGVDEPLFIYRVHEMGVSRNVAQMKLAEFTALYNNIDYRFLSKETIYQRLSQLMQENVPQLLKINFHQFAKEEVKKVLKIKYSFRHQLVYLIISLKLNLFYNYIGYVFHPGRLLIKLKFKKSFVC